MKTLIEILAMAAAITVLILPFVKPQLFEFRNEKPASAGGECKRPRLARTIRPAFAFWNINNWYGYIHQEVRKQYR